MNTEVGADLAARRAAAHALASQGRWAEAERAYDDLLRAVPEDGAALNFFAIRAHTQQRLDEAQALLERARAAHPDDPVTLVNLGTLLRERGRLDEACAALRRGTELAPDLYAARLRLGETLQALGRHREAVPAYYGAIHVAQGAGRWLSTETTEPALTPLVLHAMRVVAAGRRELFLELLRPLRERHGGAALARVEKSLLIYLGDRPAHYPEPRQRPKFLYFADLPTTAFFDRALFPWYEALEAETDAIRAEMLAVLAADSGFEPFLGHVDDASQLEDHLRGASGARAWDAYFFHRHGERRDANAARCPRTAAALEAAPLCRVRAHSPEACYSVLAPGAHILPHRGVTNTRLVTHLPLIVPDGDLALNVSGELKRWEVGRCFSFDDTYEHEAWNRSDQTRVVVLLDVWNPYLTEVEREALTALIPGIGDFNRAAGV